MDYYRKLHLINETMTAFTLTYTDMHLISGAQKYVEESLSPKDCDILDVYNLTKRAYTELDRVLLENKNITEYAKILIKELKELLLEVENGVCYDLAHLSDKDENEDDEDWEYED